jgi:catalase
MTSKMAIRTILIGSAIGLCLVSARAEDAAPAPAATSPADLVDALNSVFGKHAGTRAAHAKGFCMTGKFTPSPEAPSLSKAAQFQKEVPITARFSLGGGDPQAPDNAKDNVRGLAIRFDLGNGATSDFVMISAPVFFVKSPALFVEFLQTIATGDKDKLKAFLDAHPESTRQVTWLNNHPVPASYGGVNYWAIHAFTATNAKGDQQVVKFKAIPEAGELGLTDDEAKAKGPDFYAGEMKDRLTKGPVLFDFIGILGQQGDPTDDPTVFWDEAAHKTLPLGKVEIDQVVPDATCDAFTFTPGNLADGLAGPTNDPVFAARSPGYVVSFIRRRQSQ